MNKMLEFPLLQADDLEVRIAQVKAPENGKSGGVSLLIYKNARIDQNILDATVGRMNWQNRYYDIGGNLHCVISIWDSDKNIWVERDNVGVESNTEQTKGEASDAFKRAAFNWGIGRELYTAPFIWVTDKNCVISEYKGKWQCKTKFSVSSINYDDNRKICELVIVDQDGNTVFTFNKKSKVPSNPKPEAKSIVYPSRAKMLEDIYKKYPKDSEALSKLLQCFKIEALEKASDEQLMAVWSKNYKK